MRGPVRWGEGLLCFDGSRILSKGKQNVGAVRWKIEGTAEREEKLQTGWGLLFWPVQGEKKNSKGEGLAWVSSCGEKKKSFRFRVFCSCVVSPSNLKIAPPLQVLETSIYRQKMLLGFSTWSLNFFLFVNFDFSYFFVFFENEQYQRNFLYFFSTSTR